MLESRWAEDTEHKKQYQVLEDIRIRSRKKPYTKAIKGKSHNGSIPRKGDELLMVWEEKKF